MFKEKSTEQRKSVLWIVLLQRRAENIMKKEEKTRVEKAMDIALERLDYVIDYRTISEFVEVTGRM